LTYHNVLYDTPILARVNRSQLPPEHAGTAEPGRVAPPKAAVANPSKLSCHFQNYLAYLARMDKLAGLSEEARESLVIGEA
jgi:hypothetical protein